MINIVIIGGGLSGTLVAWNILRHPGSGKEIDLKIIDGRPENDLGTAYSTVDDFLLLNVSAEKMGADPKNPRHFINWAQGKGITVQDGDFLPRNLFRKYIQELLKDALQSKKNNITYERIFDEVTDLRIQNSHAEVLTNNHGALIADKVVLALGNFPPKDLSLKNNSYVNSKKYYSDPWKQDLFLSLTGNESVLILGTGQTTIDLLVTLHKKNHKGKITAISRHGHFPLVHKKINECAPFYNEIRNIKNIQEIFRFIRQQSAEAEKTGSDVRAVIDSMRPYTTELWLGLPFEEKRKFMRHLFRYWEIIRARMAPINDEIIQQLIKSGQLKIVAGRITEIIDNNDSIDIYYQEKGSRNLQIMNADMAVNCTGPQTDYNRIKHPLLQNLLAQGLIECDPLHLGLNAKPDGALISKDKSASNILYTIGSPLRGILWESVAVPDIKIHAENLAVKLLKSD
jgi:uncharacterized NAD(P)/FAD-binding protein YdhS